MKRFLIEWPLFVFVWGGGKEWIISYRNAIGINSLNRFTRNYVGPENRGTLPFVRFAKDVTSVTRWQDYFSSFGHFEQ